MRILFLQGFVSPEMDYKASDAVGWGITAAEAIIDGLDAFSAPSHFWTAIGELWYVESP